MAKSGEFSKLKYRETLSEACRKRYDDKIEVIGSVDPYEMQFPDSSSSCDNWPDISYPDIVNYLIYAQSAYTLQELKAYKSLESYNYFISGWVQTVSRGIVNGKFVLRAKVKHSERMNDICLQPWIICENDGNVISGHCTCMTGVSEFCSHVGALLFYIEAAVKVCNSQTVTEKKANWLPASVQKIQYKTIQEIDFTSAKTKKKKGTTPAEIKVKKLPNVSEPSADKLSKLFESLHNSGEKSAILSLVPGYACHFRPKALDKKYPQV